VKAALRRLGESLLFALVLCGLATGAMALLQFLATGHVRAW